MALSSIPPPFCIRCLLLPACCAYCLPLPISFFFSALTLYLSISAATCLALACCCTTYSLWEAFLILLLHLGMALSPVSWREDGIPWALHLACLPTTPTPPYGLYGFCLS